MLKHQRILRVGGFRVFTCVLLLTTSYVYFLCGFSVLIFAGKIAGALDAVPHAVQKCARRC